MKRFIFVSLFLLIFLVACEEEKVKVRDEKILNIEPAYEGGWSGSGAYFIVDTDVQTYTVVSRPFAHKSAVLNNDAAEDTLYFIEDILGSEYERLSLTPETYKKLSEKYAEVVGSTLTKEDLSIDEYIDEEF